MATLFTTWADQIEHRYRAELHHAGLEELADCIDWHQLTNDIFDHRGMTTYTNHTDGLPYITGTPQ